MGTEVQLTGFRYIFGMVRDVRARDLLREDTLRGELGHEALHSVRGPWDSARVGAVVARHLDLRRADGFYLVEGMTIGNQV